MSRPAAADAVLHAGGSYLTVHDGCDITSLTIEVVGTPVGCEGCDECDVHDDGSLELELPRAEVERLRDRLAEWLERGAL